MPIKKTAAPAVAKKALVKKPAKKATEKKGLVYADSEQAFWLADGQILNSLVALRDALSNMEKTVYAHHVSANKNDFADWVEKVLGDSACAKSLRSAKTPTSAQTAVVRYLKVYNA